MNRPKWLPILPHQVGFDYAAALRELHEVMTLAQIAEVCGYESKGSVLNVLNGGIPSHPQGEAIYVLYVETFNRKPPLRSAPAPFNPLTHLAAATT